MSEVVGNCCCHACGKTFSKKYNLNRHLREVHHEVHIRGTHLEKTSLTSGKWFSRCLETNCGESFQKINTLIGHLNDVHSFNFVTETLTFANKEEFVKWKISMEEETSSSYVINLYKNNKTVTYFGCNRNRTGHDGRDLSKIYKGNCKSQGPYHINTLCTSNIKLCEETEGKMTAYFQRQHYGHEVDLSKIRLPKHDKEVIATKLMNDVPCRKILRSVSESISNHLKRIDLLTAADVNNIKKSYGIDSKDGRRHENDSVSLDLWVQENMLKPTEENPILFYKKQHSDSDVLSKEDFCLVFATKLQRHMLETFGHKILTIDGTHGLNSYDFELTTLMVIDEFGQGFPVAFMFSNRKDTEIYKLFFKSIKDVVGEIQPDIFMSDLAPAYFNAWKLVMGEGDTRHLYCAWHVDRAWQTNISKVKGAEKRITVKQALKVLQQCTDKENFIDSLNMTIKMLLEDTDTQEFGKYFQSNYGNNYLKWAYCFRNKQDDINTNMHLEAMHKVVKYIYADRRTIKRLDKALSVILEFLREKSRERLIKIIKGKNTNCSRNIFERHTAAQEMVHYKHKLEDGVFYVKNLKNGNEHQVKNIKEINCCIDVCKMCNICRHRYTCDCVDFNTNKFICKHIHFVVLHQDNLADEDQSHIGSLNSSIDLLTTVLEKPQSKNMLNKNIFQILNKVTNLDIDAYDARTIDEINYHLNVLNNLCNLPGNSQEQNFVSKDSTIKKYIQPQLRFSSTKKKSDRPSTSKLTENEREETKKMLCSLPALVISTDPKEDHRYCKTLKKN